jgi:N6-adenosine-specific RNA methylase IME4
LRRGVNMDGEYRCIVADPPWRFETLAGFQTRPTRPQSPPYQMMTVADITALPVASLAAPAAHLWLWTTNRHLEVAFGVMRAWGFTYLTTITWTKPSGMGPWFVSTTQHCLFGYRDRCIFPLAKFRPTHFHAAARRHSQKPEQFFDLCEAISPPPRLELFARVRRLGWDALGDAVDGHPIQEVLAR